MGSSPPKRIKVSMGKENQHSSRFWLSVFFSGRICSMVDSDRSMIITRLPSVLRIDSFM